MEFSRKHSDGESSYKENQSIQQIRKTQEIRKLKEKNGHTTVKEMYGREHDDPMDYLDVNAAKLGMFLNATLRAAILIGQDYEANLRYVMNHLWNTVEHLSNEIGKRISAQTEITGGNTINSKKLRKLFV